MDMQERGHFYRKAFPNYPPLAYNNGWLYGVWMIGNNYKGTGYYGSYPPGYVKRVMSLFPDMNNVLHLFSGSLKKEDVGEKDVRVDLHDVKNERTGEVIQPDVCCDVHKLNKSIGTEVSDLILADPPYSEEDAAHYGVCLINRRKVFKQCYKVLKYNGYMVWLDQVFPMYRKEYWKLEGTIGIIRSTNHRVRVCFIFKKLKGE